MIRSAADMMPLAALWMECGTVSWLTMKVFRAVTLGALVLIKHTIIILMLAAHCMGFETAIWFIIGNTFGALIS